MNYRRTLPVVFLAFSIILVAAPAVDKLILSPHVSGQYHSSVQVVLNSRTKQSLVVWEKHPGNHPDHSTWARLLSPIGKPLGPIFPLVNGPNTYGPKVLFNPLRNEFLLVYANEFTTVFQLFAQRLNSRGRPIGPTVQLSAASDTANNIQNEAPHILWNSRTGNYIVFWQRYRLSTSTANIVDGLYGMILDPLLRPVKSATLVKPAARAGNFLMQAVVRDAAFHPTTQHIMIAYTQAAPDFFSSARSFYFVGDLDPLLADIRNTSFTRVKPMAVTNAFDIQLAFQTDGNGFVVYGDVANPRLRKIDSDGKLRGPAINAFRPPLRNAKLTSIAIEAGNGARGRRFVLLGVRDAFNTNGQRGLWAQILGPDGRSSGSPVLMDPLEDYAVGTAISVLPGPVSSSNYRFVAVYAKGLEVSNGLTNSGLSLILLRLNFPL